MVHANKKLCFRIKCGRVWPHFHLPDNGKGNVIPKKTYRVIAKFIFVSQATKCIVVFKIQKPVLRMSADIM